MLKRCEKLEIANGRTETRETAGQWRRTMAGTQWTHYLVGSRSAEVGERVTSIDGESGLGRAGNGKRVAYRNRDNKDSDLRCLPVTMLANGDWMLPVPVPAYENGCEKQKFAD